MFGELSNFPHKPVQTKVRVFIDHRAICAFEQQHDATHSSFFPFQKVQPLLSVKPTVQPAVVQPKRAQVQHGVPQPAPALSPSVQADVSMKEEELCQAFSNTLFPVEDIDEGDADMPQLCPEYVKDIYVYLQSLEVLAACLFTVSFFLGFSTFRSSHSFCALIAGSAVGSSPLYAWL